MSRTAGQKQNTNEIAAHSQALVEIIHHYESIEVVAVDKF